MGDLNTFPIERLLISSQIVFCDTHICYKEHKNFQQVQI